MNFPVTFVILLIFAGCVYSKSALHPVLEILDYVTNIEQALSGAFDNFADVQIKKGKTQTGEKIKNFSEEMFKTARENISRKDAMAFMKDYIINEAGPFEELLRKNPKISFLLDNNEEIIEKAFEQVMAELIEAWDNEMVEGTKFRESLKVLGDVMDSTEGKKEKETRKIISEKIPEFRNAITHLTHTIKKRATDEKLVSFALEIESIMDDDEVLSDLLISFLGNFQSIIKWVSKAAGGSKQNKSDMNDIEKMFNLQTLRDLKLEL